MTTKTYPCSLCGAKLEFSPGQHALKCPYCGGQNQIEVDASVQSVSNEELDYQDYLNKQAGNEAVIEQQTVKCTACGAQSQFGQHIVSDRCPFCAAPMIAANAYSKRQIQPKAIAPFDVKESEARKKFSDWVAGLWFAPNALKRAYRADRGLKGIYTPYWTYDAESHTTYQGQRGDDYTVTENYIQDGETKTRQVTKTDWTFVAGEVDVNFDDVLVIASKTLPKQYADNLAPWNLNKLQSYRDEYVSGFTVEAYQIPLEPGFVDARSIMEDTIRNTICRDIGGDHQRITAMQPRYSKISFKHILLPIWLSSYKYGEKTYRFLVNGQTGEVQGERPYSYWKIAGAALCVFAMIMVLIAFAKTN
ncbi:hypothetical protein [Undibacterium fentianense]|uniref:Primosomal protein N' (Replication factor Y)-superfamily II helicase n=1 Tax=Undibacterium fentianense TaxID=2828728 RepID=A0A941E1W1_9BURK|nr:hypothetical protein [Undibacterium fentianense]MBR7801759.1 hypothetical protein [Undibacterium fentianense]